MMRFLFLVFPLVFLNAQADEGKSLCEKDDRVVSQVKPIARLLASSNADAGCTGTLISPSCMISAGHCKPELGIAEFDTPLSNARGQITHSSALNQYPVESIIASRYEGVGKDWSVFKLKVNPISLKSAGATRGFYKMNLSSLPFFKPTVVRITGYGASAKPELNFVQQTGKGKIIGSTGSVLKYKVDTTGGNSGSAIILETTHEIIGIHTNGGCEGGGDDWGNQGTLFVGNPDLVQAIRQCQALDR